ncbi:uncharacterized protein LOC114933731 [Nylanderia fulva]|uniref:uncharacterized protein LOC114933731 n=1 Tax=Nylanderia fulva TaxID=613905 RepID=UPI0010FB5AFB|nr:uncharacterized protein LOC114933731 [Nylanderia fulva]
MSKSLVHKSLELLNEKDLRKEQKKKKKRKDARYKGVLDLIPTKHRIVSKQHEKTDFDTVLARSNKTTLYETQKCIAAQQDPTEKNVQRLLSLSKNHLNSETANKLLHRAIKKRYSQQQEKPKESEQTAFTEEDFKKFEQEYLQT